MLLNFVSHGTQFEQSNDIEDNDQVERLSSDASSWSPSIEWNDLEVRELASRRSLHTNSSSHSFSMI